MSSDETLLVMFSFVSSTIPAAPAAASRPVRRQRSGGRGQQPGGLPALGDVPPTTVKLGGLSVTLTEQGPAKKIIRLNDLTGELKYTPGLEVTVNLAGQVGDGVSAGSITVIGHATGLYDATGAVTPALASGLRWSVILFSSTPQNLTQAVFILECSVRRPVRNRYFLLQTPLQTITYETLPALKKDLES